MICEVTRYVNEFNLIYGGGRDNASWNNSKTPSSAVRYAKCSFYLTIADFHRTSLIVPSLAYGFHWLLRLRLGAFTTQAMAERTDNENVKLNNGKCPCCPTLGVQDSMVHFILLCPDKKFANIRRKLELRQSSLALVKAANPDINMSKVTDSVLVDLLCGGTVAIATVTKQTTTTSVSLRKEVVVNGDTLKDVVDGIPDLPKSQRQQSLLKIGFLLLAAYLQEAIPHRNKSLWGPPKPTPSKPR
jgi:hypothetical protein